VAIWTSHQPTISQRSLQPFLWFDNLLEWFTQLRSILYLLLQFIIKNVTPTGVGEDAGKKEPSYTVDGNVN
jgi:hypothetical protein